MRFLLALWATNFKAALALRVAFVMQTGFMLLNNLLFFVFWWVMFERFEQIRGWRIEDVAVLFGVSAAGFGLAAVFAGGVPDLSRRIQDGDLDPMLTLPRSVLVQAAAARTRADGLGDIASGLLLVGFAGYGAPERMPVVLLAIVLSASVLVASGVLVHSAAFWLGRIEAVARQIGEFLLTFSVYPPPLFGGALRVLLFTLIPAGFVAYLPARLVRDFDVGTLVLAVGGSVLYAVVAWWVFHAGLRQYASGSRFGVRD